MGMETSQEHKISVCPAPRSRGMSRDPPRCAAISPRSHGNYSAPSDSPARHTDAPRGAIPCRSPGRTAGPRLPVVQDRPFLGVRPDPTLFSSHPAGGQVKGSYQNYRAAAIRQRGRRAGKTRPDRSGQQAGMSSGSIAAQRGAPSRLRPWPASKHFPVLAGQSIVRQTVERTGNSEECTLPARMVGKRWVDARHDKTSFEPSMFAVQASPACHLLWK
jgi:hypothetical protein